MQSKMDFKNGLQVLLGLRKAPCPLTQTILIILLHISTWNFLSNGFKIEKELYS
jgi:hypothetical protein